MNKEILHEIRSELSQVIGYVDLVGCDIDRCESRFEHIKECVYRIDTLISEERQIDTANSFTSYTKDKTISVGSILDTKNIMIVDDIADNRNTLENILSLFKCNVECVSSGADALQLYERFKPDIVFMDIVMPEMNGDKVTRLLKEMGSTAIFIAISALKEYSEKNISIFDAWLPKPYTIDQILDAIVECSFCDLEDKDDSTFVKKMDFSDISETEKTEILKRIVKGAISELEVEVDKLKESKSKEWLKKKLSNMDLNVILKNLNRRKFPR